MLALPVQHSSPHRRLGVRTYFEELQPPSLHHVAGLSTVKWWYAAVKINGGNVTVRLPRWRWLPIPLLIPSITCIALMSLTSLPYHHMYVWEFMSLMPLHALLISLCRLCTALECCLYHKENQAVGLLIVMFTLHIYGLILGGTITLSATLKNDQITQVWSL